jgi:glyoxylase-like metal-dependent hydrolase (beta-lactamase superfamily II)
MERRKFITDAAKYASLTLVGASQFNNNLFASTANMSNTLATPFSNGITHKVSNYQHVTTTVKLRGKDVKVHALCTGKVAVKTNFKTKKGFGELAKLSILFDKHYTEYLPIWVWVIEHPDGLIVVDTGEISAVTQLGQYLSEESELMKYFFRHSARFNVNERDELNYQFEKVNLKVDDVKLVVLTHLHLDHTDGLKFFPKQEIIVGKQEFQHASGNMPTTYPKWFNPNKVDYKNDRIEVFNQAYPITTSEDLLYIPTPGHTHGHSSVLFKTDDFDLLFAGDISYDQQQVINGELAGISADYKKSKQTYKQIIDYSTHHQTIYLPSHDPNAGQRLTNKVFLV